MNLLAWLTAGAAGWFWVSVSMPQPAAPPWIRLARTAALALAFGTGATASLFFALLWSGLAPGVAAWTADGIVLTAGAALWWARRRRQPVRESSTAAAPLPYAWLAGIAAAASSLAFFAALFIMLKSAPQGDWDAWSVWNVRAKFLASGDFWRNAVSPELSAAHPESPLLWPSAVARAWSESEQVVETAPQTGAFFASLTLVALFASGLAARTAWQWGALGTAAFLMTVSLWRLAPTQYPDIPLTVFLLGSVIAAEVAQRSGWNLAGLALSGALASFGAFTKNEGLAFFVILGAILAASARLRALWWLAGGAPVVALTVLFHTLLAPSATLVRAASFRQAGRLWTALSGMASEAWQLGELPAHPVLFLLLLFLAFRPKWPWRPLWPAVAALLLWAAHVAALWGSTSDIQWQVNTAANRLFFQAWPLLLLSAFWWIAQSEPPSPEKPAPPYAGCKPKSASIPKR